MKGFVRRLIDCRDYYCNIGPEAKWLSSEKFWFKYRRQIVVTEQSGSNLIDYQILIELNSSNFDFSHVNNDGSDIRFSDAFPYWAGNVYSYWIEKWDSINQEAKIWVKVPSIPASSSTSFYMYYGNPNVASASNGEDTFEFFDDFEDGIIDTKWTTSDDRWVEQDGYILANTSDWISDGLHARNLSINLPFIIETRSLVSATYADVVIKLIFSDDSLQSVHWVASNPESYSDFFGSKMDWAMSQDTWYNFMVKPVRDGEQKWYLDGELKNPQTSVSLPSSIKEISLGGKGYARWDFIRLRKYANPEPSVGIGDEETP